MAGDEQSATGSTLEPTADAGAVRVDGPSTVSRGRGSGHRWRVTRPGGESFTMTTAAPATLAEMREQYPGATIESLLEGAA